MRIFDQPSPNHDARPDGQAIDMIVLHYTDMESAGAAIARLSDPEARVSAHYVIDEDGTIVRLVPEQRRAWHAGVSAWAGRRGLNGCSIGIELVNPGHSCGYRPFPAAQIDSLITLTRDIAVRYAIPRQRVLGHSDIAPARKVDPGELFPWDRLAAEGLGLWAEPAAGPMPGEAGLLELLGRIGFAAGGADAPLPAVIAAVQRHWRPARIDGTADAETVALIRGLAAASVAATG